MAIVNEDFFNIKNDYLFSMIEEKKKVFKENNPDKKIISLGIGDVSLPLVPTVINAMEKATKEMSKKESFRGYGIVQGYDFLIERILEVEYKKRGINLEKNEIFIGGGSKSDLAGFIGGGSKSDLAGVSEIFSKNSKVALMDPVYPAYRDVNIMLGRNDITYLKGIEENNFIPKIPNEHIDIIYLCSPNNPTGTALTKKQLELWVKFNKKTIRALG